MRTRLSTPQQRDDVKARLRAIGAEHQHHHRSIRGNGTASGTRRSRAVTRTAYEVSRIVARADGDRARPLHVPARPPLKSSPPDRRLAEIFVHDHFVIGLPRDRILHALAWVSASAPSA